MVFDRFLRFVKKETNIVIVGLDGAGKTSILRFLQYGSSVATEPTLGYDIEEISIFGLKVKVWDMGGQKQFRKLWGEHVEKSDAMIYVVDGSDHKRLDEAKNEFWKIYKYIKPNVPIAFVINKIDLPNVISEGELIEKFELNKVKNNPFQIFRTSAKYGFGIIHLFGWIYRKITGKLVKMNVSIDDFILLNKEHRPIVSLLRDKDIPTDYITLLTNILSSLQLSKNNTYSYATMETMKRKFILYKYEDLIGLAVTPQDEEDVLVQHVLERVLKELKEENINVENINSQILKEKLDKALFLGG